MCDELTGLDFPLESLPADLLVSTDNDILRGFGDSELDLDSLLNSNLDDDIMDSASSNIDSLCRSGRTSLTSENANTPNLINRIPEQAVNQMAVKQEPLGNPNQSPVLESLLKSTAASSPCVNPVPQTSTTSFAPTISGRMSVSTTAPSDTVSADNELILAALLKRHEEDRKLLDHLVSDYQRTKTTIKERVVPAPIQVPVNIVQKPLRPVKVEQPTVPAQVVVATPVSTSRPVGIISGTRMFVTTPAVELDCPSPEMTDKMDTGDDDYGYDDEPCRPKTKRRSSHNAIEKRYRLSINTRIDELRTLIDGADSKLSKSAVLRRAIERIRSTERENRLLRKELMNMDPSHRLLSRELVSEVKNESRLMEESESSPEPISASITSPDSSLEGSPPLSPQDQKLSAAGSKAPRLAHLLMKHEPPNATFYQALGSRTRICMAGFFLTLFFVNPLALWNPSLKSGNSQMFTPGGAFVHGGRSLMDYWDKEQEERNYHKWFAYTLFAVLLIISLILLLRKKVFRKTGIMEQSKQSTESELSKNTDDIEFMIWRHWKQAEAHISEGSWCHAVTELKSVLIASGEPFPISRGDWCFYTLRQLFYAIGWVKKSSDLLKSDTADLSSRALSKLISLSFHDLLPLNYYQRIIVAFSLFINLKKGHLSKENKCQAFVNLSFVIPLFRSRLRRYAVDSLQSSEASEVPSRLRWILNPEGYRFFEQFKMKSLTQEPMSQSEFDSDTSRIDLSEGVTAIAFVFRRKLFEEALELIAKKDEKRLEEVLGLLTLLIECSANAELSTTTDDNSLNSDNGMDYVQHWWGNMSAVAALWNHERWDKSRSFHSVVDSPPHDIKVIRNYKYRIQSQSPTSHEKSETNVNKLAQAILLAYRVQRRSIFGPGEVPRPCTHNALKLADEAAILLENSVLGKSEKEKSHWIWCAIAADWLLTSRLSLSRPPNSLSGADEDAQVHKFERDLSILHGALKRADLSSPDSNRRWLVMHQARLRLWRGSHPVRTALTLRRNNPSDRDNKDDETDAVNEVSYIRDWLQQRLMRPRAGMNGLK